MRDARVRRTPVFGRGVVVRGRYLIQRICYTARKSNVFHVWDYVDCDVRALKVSTDSSAETRHVFDRERNLLRSIRLESLPQLIDGGELPDGRAFLVTEWLEGADLLEITSGGPLPWRDAFRVVHAIARILESLHTSGILHRDIKPANIVIPPASVGFSFDRARLIDLGVARRMTEIAETANMRMNLPTITGTLAYMAPEQIAGRWESSATDIFCLGALLYELIHGRPPMGHTPELIMARVPNMTGVRFLTGAFAYRRLTEDVSIPDDSPLPIAGRALLAEMLRRDPQERPSCARVVCERIDTLLSETTRSL
jgi:eukaryotic-like serine/threonine-protein kinase